MALDLSALRAPGTPAWVYPHLRAAIVERVPAADAVLPSCYDAASRDERKLIDLAVGAMVRELAGVGEEPPLSAAEALHIVGTSTGHLSAARNLLVAVEKRFAHEAAAKGDERGMMRHLREAQRLLEGG